MPADRPTRRAYDLLWPIEMDALAIEFEMIRRGGRFKFNGKDKGKGLFHHYREAQKLLWPEDDIHRWSDLVLTRIIENEITVIMGAGDSNKTYSVSKFVLTDWWAWPNNTLWLLSSTELRGAELRIWGAIKNLFNRARMRFPGLPGNVLESKHAITTEEISEDGSEARVLTKGLIFIPCKQGNQWVGMGAYAGVKPVRYGNLEGRLGHVGDEGCFVTGTMVDKPWGKKPIEKIKAGECVLGAVGENRVEYISKRYVSELVTVHTHDGRKITCTPNHLFFTSEGWKAAGELVAGAYILSSYESMQILWSANREQAVLRAILHSEMVHNHIGGEGDLLQQTARCQDIGVEKEMARGTPETLKANHGNHVESSRAQGGIKKEELECVHESGGMQAEDSRRERNRTNQGGIYAAGNDAGTEMEPLHQNWKMERKWIPYRLQSGLRDSRDKAGNRSGRTIPLRSQAQECGHEKGYVLTGAWVDRVEVLEPADIQRLGGGKKGIAVYNLEVKGHPSYSVNGLLVHNSFMERSFLDAYSNWYGKPNFKGIITGNPHDLDDTLCVAGEPVGGWESWHDDEKTQEWRSTFYNAHVIALDGRDSPNNDFPEDKKPRYPYLVGKKKIEAVVKTHGIDSWQYFNQCVGKPRALGNVKRVLTRQLCENNHAFEGVIWAGSEVTRVGFMDAAYGGVGGDRCVAGYLEFGKDVEGKSVIALHPPVIVPVSVRNLETPEIQISRWVKQYCYGLDIPPEHFFFDGRGTLAVEMARTWNPAVNVVDFGGPATKRPVSREEYTIDEKTEVRRLKRCDEMYSKFVTELWFSIYYLVIGHQLRQLPKDVASEGYKREWYYTKGNRIEVEPKDEMKRRTNQSPDLMDAVVAGVEGARRLGFVIENMRDGANAGGPDNTTLWLEDELDKHKAWVKKGEITYG